MKSILFLLSFVFSHGFVAAQKIQGYRSSIKEHHGEFFAQYVQTSMQMPFLRNDPYFMNFGGSGALNLGILPIKYQYFFSTQSQTFFNSNSVQVSVDFQKLLHQKRWDNFNQLKKEGQKLSSMKKYKDSLSKEYLQLKSEINMNSPQKDSIYNFPYEQKTTSISKSKIYNRITPPSLGPFKKQTSLEETKRYLPSKDSVHHLGIHHPYDTSFMDSVRKNQKKMDDLQATNILEQKEKLEQIENKILAYQALIQKQSERLKQAKANYKKDKELSLNGKQNILSKAISGSKNLRWGNYQAHHSTLGLNQIPLRGLGYSFANEQWFLKVDFGRTFSQFAPVQTNPSSAEKIDYNRKIRSFQLGMGNHLGSHLFFTSSFCSDDPSQKNINTQSNWVHGLGLQTKKLGIDLQTEFQYSTPIRWLHQQGTKIESLDSLSSTISQIQAFKNRTAWLFAAKTKWHSNVRLASTYQRVHHGFRHMGNPFLQKDADLLEIKLSSKCFENKVHLSGFYRKSNHQLNGVRSSKNYLQGYGINAQTRWQKHPNVQIMYTPFEQGQKHMNRFLRANNQYKMMFFSLLYRRKLKETQWLSILNYTQSQVEYWGHQNTMAETHIFSSNNRLTFSKNHFANFNYTRSTCQPNIDSISFQSAQIAHQLGISKKMNLNYQFNMMFYDNKGVHHRVGFGLHFAQEAFHFRFKFFVGEINKVWGLHQKDYVTSQLSANYRF